MELAAKENGQTFKQNLAAFPQDLPLTNGNIYEPTP